MAEYINKKQFDRKFIIKMLSPRTTTIFDVRDIIDKLPTADVIERSKINRAIEEIEREINSDFWNNSFCDGMKYAREILERNIGESNNGKR